MRDGRRGTRLLVARAFLGTLLALLLPSVAAGPVDRAAPAALIDGVPGQNALPDEGQTLHRRLRDRSAAAVRVPVSSVCRGAVVGGLRQDAAALFPAGDREATVWLAYPDDAKTGQVRVGLCSPSKARLALADSPLGSDATGPGEPTRRATTSWVAARTPTQRERIAETSSAADEAIGFDPLDLIFLCVPGYFVLQAALAFRTSGRWRMASLVPAVGMAPVVAFTVLAFAAQSNLWPILLILTAPLACLYLVGLTVILLLRRLARRA